MTLHHPERAVAKKKGKKKDKDKDKKRKKKVEKQEKKKRKALEAKQAKQEKKAARKATRKTPPRAAKKAAGKSTKPKKRHQPETLRLRAIQPALVVDDLERSRSFYTDGLGFTVDEEMKDPGGRVQAIQLKAGHTRILLAQDDFAKGRDRIKGEG